MSARIPGRRLVGELWSRRPREAATAFAMLIAASVTGAVQFAVLNQAVLHPRTPAIQLAAAVVFALLLGVAFWLRWRGAARLSSVLEKTMLDRRRHLFETMRGAELRTFETLDGVDGTLRRDLDHIVALAPILVDCLFYAVLLLSFAVYLATVATSIAFVWAITILCVIADQRGQRTAQQAATDRLDAAWAMRRRRIDQLTRGFAMLKMDAAAATALRAEARRAAEALDAARRDRSAFNHRTPAVAAAVFYLGLGVVLFSAPITSTLSAAARFEVIIIMFISINAASILAREVHGFAAADAALDRVDALEAALGAVVSPTPTPPMPPVAGAFERIAFEGVCFSYDPSANGSASGSASFTIGPLDLELRRGEVVFITGGNGSGKTTLMKVLTGLYPPRRGRILIDGRPITGDAIEPYRALFTAVFMEHHLFGPTYGLDHPDPARVAALLARFNLDGIVRCDGDHFAPLELSTGQRKRLAMVIALLEDRPIYVLDEWAAHQDPELRRDFYERLVPELRAAGKTVVAISHDARFFHLADRRLHLDGGRLMPPLDPRSPPGPA